MVAPRLAAVLSALLAMSVPVHGKCFKKPDANGHVNWPKQKTAIGKNLFRKCLKLKTINLPPEVEFVDDAAFFSVRPQPRRADHHVEREGGRAGEADGEVCGTDGEIERTGLREGHSDPRAGGENRRAGATLQDGGAFDFPDALSLGAACHRTANLVNPL